MTTFSGAPIGGAAPVIDVASAEELRTALDRATEGQVIRLAAGDYGRLDLSDYNREVTLLSDPDAPATFSHLGLNNVSGLTMDGLEFDLDFVDGYMAGVKTFRIENSQGITIRNSVFEGDTAFGGNVDETGQGSNGGVGLYISRSQDITVESSEISGFYRGLGIYGSDGVTLKDNDVHDIREDFLNMSAVNDLLVEDNHFHDRSKAEGSGDHPDMIQLMTQNVLQASTGITIRGNIFDAGEGNPSQTIFMPNHCADRPEGEQIFFEDILIENNLILNGMPNGIIVGATEGLVVRNNTLLTAGSAETGLQSPNIRLDARSSDVLVEGNVVEGVIEAAGEGWTVSNNYRVQSGNPAAPDYLADHFIAPYGDLGGHPEKVLLRPDSPIFQSGAGAPFVWEATPEDLTALAVPVEQENRAAYVFDASLSAGPAGLLIDEAATFLWEFSDGTTATGAEVLHVFSGPGTYTARLTVTDASGATAMTETGVTVTGSELIVFNSTEGTFQSTRVGMVEILHEVGSKGLDLGALDGTLNLKRAAFADIFQTGHFEIDMTLSANEARASGELLRLHGAFQVVVEQSGEIAMTLFTTEGRLVLRSSGAGLNDGASHAVTLTYDAAQESLGITVDGALVGDMPVPGQLGSGSGRDMTLGGAFGREAFDGTLTDFTLRSTPDSYHYREPSVDLGFDALQDLAAASEMAVVDKAALLDSLTAVLPVCDGTDARDILWASKSGGVVNGNDGNDVLRGYGGSDIFTGGEGADKFVFDLRMGSEPSHDIATDLDFSEGDRLYIYTAEEGAFDDATGIIPVSSDGSGLWFTREDQLSKAIEIGVLEVSEGDLGVVLSVAGMPGHSFELAFYTMDGFDLIV